MSLGHVAYQELSVTNRVRWKVLGARDTFQSKQQYIVFYVESPGIAPLGRLSRSFYGEGTHGFGGLGGGGLGTGASGLAAGS
jgi:hypothetical protein